MEKFTLPHINLLKEQGYQHVVIMQRPDEIIVMPLKVPVDKERLEFLNLKQLHISDPELESIAHQSSMTNLVKIQFSPEFKIT